MSKSGERVMPYKTTVSVSDFLKKFSDEPTAMKFIERIRWGGHVHCPYCDSSHVHFLGETDRKYKCYDCKQQFTVRKGISSVQLAQKLGCTQKTAWFLAHRIREAFCAPDGLVSGLVDLFNGIESMWALLKRGSSIAT